MKPYIKISFSQNNGEDYNQYDNEKDYDSNTGPFPRILLVLPGYL